MPTPIVITAGERFDHLVAVAPARSARRGQHWLFRCDCGTEVVRQASRVRSGIIRSCGCQHGNTKPGRRRKDGRPSPEYNAWRTIKARTTSPKHRGVRMCEAWFESFDAFLADMGPKPSPQHTIERLDSDDDYRPGNCVWTTTPKQRSKPNATGYPGVCAKGRKFRAMIRRNGRKIHLGLFATAAEAGAAYQRAKQSR